jgi:Cys-tRNA(Pro)/Cys-tRNA(Cys) deacylase
MEVVEALGQEPGRMFKTLVTQGASKEYYVFMVPVNGELNLKKAAKAVGEKSIAMIKSKELLPLTGYIHGGCSPIGMKKFFRTTVHRTAEDYPTIFVSAGKRGHQAELSLDSLRKMIRLETADLIRS